MEILAGKVRKFYKMINVASIELCDCLRVNDNIHVQGHITDFDQKVESMEMNHMQIAEARPGDVVGIKLKDYARKNDLVYRIQE